MKETSTYVYWDNNWSGVGWSDIVENSDEWCEKQINISEDHIQSHCVCTICVCNITGSLRKWWYSLMNWCFY